MVDMRFWGCKGGACPQQERCARFLERDTDERPHTLYTPPYNMYNDGIKTEFRCGYQVPKKQDEES